jgi:hypothetical protein
MSWLVLPCSSLYLTFPALTPVVVGPGTERPLEATGPLPLHQVCVAQRKI